MSDMDTLIDVQTLAALPREWVLPVDCRFVLSEPGSGERNFMEGHIAGAVYADLDRDLSDLSKQGLGRHPLPDVAAFAQVLSGWGWYPGLRMVAYDAAGGAMAAARLWWMLAGVGIPASVLDGGWPAWQAARLPTARGAAGARTPTSVVLHFDSHRVVGYEEVAALRQRPDSLILDARGEARFRGDFEPIDRVAGHVPGARNLPFSRNLASDGRFKPADMLRKEFDAVLSGRVPSEVVHMCGSGVYACHNQLAMEVAGLHRSRVFVPSWSGWSSDPSRPVETGEVRP